MPGRAQTASNRPGQGKGGTAEIPARLAGGGGSVAKTDAENLYEDFSRHKAEMLLFSLDPNLPFADNRAELDIFMAKVKQKASGCFQPPKHAEACCRISNRLKSTGYMGYGPLAAVWIALGEHRGSARRRNACSPGLKVRRSNQLEAGGAVTADARLTGETRA